VTTNMSWEDSMQGTLIRGPKGLIATAALIALGFGAPALAQEQLSIATGGTGGVYYPMGGGLAEVINNHVDGYRRHRRGHRRVGREHGACRDR
jgi:hypothetical protein